MQEVDKVYNMNMSFSSLYVFIFLSMLQELMHLLIFSVKIFEYDTRFSVYGSDFIPFDYKFPLHVPKEMASDFDLVIADPPFLSEECLTKTAVTIKFLSKKNILLCTGNIFLINEKKLNDLKIVFN